ncbi:MAG: translation elongation factor Ts [Anaerolineae bacterium]
MAVKVTAADVKALREMTGAGPLDCKKALEENDGDVEKAAEFLRQKGMASAVKKLNKGRTMNEGKVEIYQHHDGRLGVIVEVNCETDFVAATDGFQSFAKDIALHISSMAPLYITRDDVPEDVVAGQRAAFAAMDDLEGKPDNIKEKIIEGRLDKWFQQVVLMEQEFLKDDSKTIDELLKETVAELGESIQIGRFSRFALGEYGDDESDEAGDE